MRNRSVSLAKIVRKDRENTNIALYSERKAFFAHFVYLKAGMKRIGLSWLD